MSRFISQMMQDRAVVTMEGEYETATKLSNGTSLNDLSDCDNYEKRNVMISIIINFNV